LEGDHHISEGEKKTEGKKGSGNIENVDKRARERGKGPPTFLGVSKSGLQ